MEFYADLSEKYVRNIITWNDNVTPSETLMHTAKEAFENVQSDLDMINRHITVMKMGEFQKVNCSDQGVYEHLYIYKHMVYSNTTTTMTGDT